MSLILNKKITNFVSRKKDLETRYRGLREKILDADDSGQLEMYYDMLLRLDEIAFQAHCEKAELDILKQATDKEKRLVAEIEELYNKLERMIPVPDLIAEVPELAIIRRQISESAVEAGKIHYQIVLNENKRKAAKGVGPNGKRLKSSPTINWLDTEKWDREHVKYLFEASSEGNSVADKTELVQSKFLKHLGVTISPQVILYLFLHYGIREVEVKAKELNDAFDEAYLANTELPISKKQDPIRAYIKQKIGYNLSKNDCFRGIRFRDLLLKVYGTIKEPVENYEGFFTKVQPSDTEISHETTLPEGIWKDESRGSIPHPTNNENDTSELIVSKIKNIQANQKNKVLNAEENKESNDILSSPIKEITPSAYQEALNSHKGKIDVNHVLKNKSFERGNSSQYTIDEKNKTPNQSTDGKILIQDSNKQNPLFMGKIGLRKNQVSTDKGTNFSQTSLNEQSIYGETTHNVRIEDNWVSGTKSEGLTQYNSKSALSDVQNLDNKDDVNNSAIKKNLGVNQSDILSSVEKIDLKNSSLAPKQSNNPSDMKGVDSPAGYISTTSPVVNYSSHSFSHSPVEKDQLSKITKLPAIQMSELSSKQVSKSPTNLSTANMSTKLLSHLFDSSQKPSQLWNQPASQLSNNITGESHTNTIMKPIIQSQNPPNQLSENYGLSDTYSPSDTLPVVTSTSSQINPTLEESLQTHHPTKVGNSNLTTGIYPQKIPISSLTEAPTRTAINYNNPHVIPSLGNTSINSQSLTPHTSTLPAQLNTLSSTMRVPPSMLQSQKEPANTSINSVENSRRGLKISDITSQEIAKRKQNKNNIFEELIYQIIISERLDEYYQKQFENLNYSSYWSFHLNKLITTTVDFLACNQSMEKESLEIGRMHLVDLIILRVKRDFKMNIKPELIKNRLITMMEHEVFSTKGCELINEYIV